MTETIKQEDTSLKDKVDKRCHIIVWNDDVTPFDVVILAFIEILGHGTLQAEQLAMNIHHTGKASVKNGTFDDLRPLAEGLIDRGINATIEDK